MLATQNPEAVKRINERRKLPPVGWIVMYWLRPGQVYSGRQSAPALVVKSDRDNDRLDLLVFYDHQDTMTMERVPRRIGDEMGWDYVEGSQDAEIEALHRDIAELRESFETFMGQMNSVLFGNHDPNEESFEDRIRRLGEDVRKLKPKPGLKGR